MKRVIHFCLEDSKSEGRSRVPLTPEKRTRGDAIAENPWYNHKKQSATIRDNGSVSRMSYHRVPFNYPEKNKKERIPRSTSEGSVEFSETVDLKSHCRTPGASTDSCPDQSIRVRSVMG